MEAVRIEDLVVGFAESELPRVQATLNLTGECFFAAGMGGFDLTSLRIMSLADRAVLLRDNRFYPLDNQPAGMYRHEGDLLHRVHGVCIQVKGQSLIMMGPGLSDSKFFAVFVHETAHVAGDHLYDSVERKELMACNISTALMRIAMRLPGGQNLDLAPFIEESERNARFYQSRV